MRIHVYVYVYTLYVCVMYVVSRNVFYVVPSPNSSQLRTLYSFGIICQVHNKYNYLELWT